MVKDEFIIHEEGDFIMANKNNEFCCMCGRKSGCTCIWCKE